MGSKNSRIVNAPQLRDIALANRERRNDIEVRQLKLEITERDRTLVPLLVNFRNRILEAGITNHQFIEIELNHLMTSFGSPSFDYEQFVSRELTGQRIARFTRFLVTAEQVDRPRAIRLIQTTSPAVIPSRKNYPEDIPLSDECVVCLENNSLLITGCRHIVCSNCMEKINGKCPVCREPICESLIKRR